MVCGLSDGFIYSVCDFNAKCFRRKANEVILFMVHGLKIYTALRNNSFTIVCAQTWHSTPVVKSRVAYLLTQVEQHEFSCERMSHFPCSVIMCITKILPGYYNQTYHSVDRKLWNAPHLICHLIQLHNCSGGTVFCCIACDQMLGISYMDMDKLGPKLCKWSKRYYWSRSLNA